MEQTVYLSTGVVHYTEHGQGPPLVLLHANPGDSQDFEAVIPTLAQDYRVLALDWPGYGKSAIPQQLESVGVLFFYEILREFLVELKLPPAFLIGNSLGGNAAARLASASPELVRGLVLVAPGGFTPQTVLTRAFCWLQGSRFSLSPRHMAGFYLKHRTPTVNSILQRASTVQASPDCIKISRALWRSFATPENDLRQSAQTIKAPTLLLFGEQDPLIPASRDGKVAARCIPTAQFVELPCGHEPFAEVPDLFLATVQPFLAKL